MPRKRKMPTIEELEAMVDRGEDTSIYFKDGVMKPAFKGTIKAVDAKEVHRTTVDFSLKMISELDRVAHETNISRQAVIKMLVKEGLNRHWLAEASKENLKKSG